MAEKNILNDVLMPEMRTNKHNSTNIEARSKILALTSIALMNVLNFKFLIASSAHAVLNIALLFLLLLLLLSLYSKSCKFAF